ncbi:hypothetical protein MtrunA17_Chr4g0021681 [Medicago truncatula]|uniref:Uncharacterized protein n=1 Tax=Medicago truncatula TaxID=3880 RepID=A0A396I398_MEDTR|nr:hypothetical protein MtrunA17_Chr4g0021681 [Medicago truncatula]
MNHFLFETIHQTLSESIQTSFESYQSPPGLFESFQLSLDTDHSSSYYSSSYFSPFLLSYMV